VRPHGNVAGDVVAAHVKPAVAGALNLSRGGAEVDVGAAVAAVVEVRQRIGRRRSGHLLKDVTAPARRCALCVQ
jgi:hypothetical protein